MSFGIKGLARFRANIFVQQGAVAGAFRLIPFKIRGFHELGLPPIVQELCKKPRGLILVTGPTGSGKSTTLAAMIDKINTDDHGHIITIEDPVEFLHEHKNCVVNQREVGADTQSFKKALKSILRQDPDVVLVGELRDLETIEAALTIAETGHVCFGTLHTNGCVSDHQPHHRRLSRLPAAADPRAAVVRARGRAVAVAGAEAGGRARAGARGHDPDAGDPQPHPRGQDPPDLFADAARPGEVRHADGEPVSALARLARSRSRWSRRSSTAPIPRSCKNMIAVGRLADDAAADSGRRRGRDTMPSFAWEGSTRAGEVRKGMMEAEAEPDVANRLRSQGITMSKAKKKAKDIEIKLPFGWGQGVPEKDLVVFTRQFATMIDAGLPIVQCLDILATQSPNKNFQKVLVDVKAQRRAGLDLLRRAQEASEGLRRPLRQPRRRRARSAASSTRS